MDLEITFFEKKNKNISMKLSFASYIVSSIEVIFMLGLDKKERSFLNPWLQQSVLIELDWNSKFNAVVRRFLVFSKCPKNEDPENQSFW